MDAEHAEGNEDVSTKRYHTTEQRQIHYDKQH